MQSVAVVVVEQKSSGVPCPADSPRQLRLQKEHHPHVPNLQQGERRGRRRRSSMLQTADCSLSLQSSAAAGLVWPLLPSPSPSPSACLPVKQEEKDTSDQQATEKKVTDGSSNQSLASIPPRSPHKITPLLPTHGTFFFLSRLR